MLVGGGSHKVNRLNVTGCTCTVSGCGMCTEVIFVHCNIAKLRVDVVLYYPETRRGIQVAGTNAMAMCNVRNTSSNITAHHPTLRY